MLAILALGLLHCTGKKEASGTNYLGAVGAVTLTGSRHLLYHMRLRSKGLLAQVQPQGEQHDLRRLREGAARAPPRERGERGPGRGERRDGQPQDDPGARPDGPERVQSVFEICFQKRKRFCDRELYQSGCRQREACSISISSVAE